MRIPFHKLQSQGNDFVFIDEKDVKNVELNKLASRILDRHFGVGGDTLVIYNMEHNFLRFFNPDGSEAEICGNALLAYGEFLRISQEQSGSVEVATKGKKAKIIFKEKIIVRFEIKDFKFEKITIFLGKRKIQGYYTKGFGNPHFVLINPDVDFKKASEIEKHNFFPEGTNVDFITINSRNEVIHRIWERGAGETLSCASGALSSFMIIYALGLVDEKVSFVSRGGILLVKKYENSVFLSGKPEYVFNGELILS